MFNSIQSEEVVLSANDWIDVLRIKPYSDIKIPSRDYKAMKISKFALKHCLALKKIRKEKDSVPTIQITNGKAHVISLKPLNFTQWEKLRMNFKSLLKANGLPEDFFEI